MTTSIDPSGAVTAGELRAGPRSSGADRRFPLGLTVIGVAALAWRILYVTVVFSGNPTAGDGYYYHQQANLLADGFGFANPFVWQINGSIVPTAQHPPLYSLVLSLASLLGGQSFLAHKLVSCVIGAATVVVIGLVARTVGGARAGLVAAGVAAAYPNLWLVDGLVLSEDLFALTIGLSILAAYRLRRSPSPVNALLLGAAIAIAALTRGEAIMLVVLLAAPLLLLTRSIARARRLRLLGIVIVAAGVVIAPWVIRNMTAFERPVYLSSNTDGVLSVANCNQTYHGRLLGFWFYPCDPATGPGDESQRALHSRELGLRYMREHAGRVPVVVAARIGRIWDVFRPFQNAELTGFEGRPLWGARLGLWVYWLTIPFAVAGAWVLHRRGLTLIPFVAQIVLVTVTGAIVYGAVRFRLPGEVVFVSLAGVAIDVALVRFASGPRAAAQSTPTPTSTPAPAQ